MLDYLLYKIGEFLVTSLPWGLAYRVGAFFADLQFRLSKKDREAVFANLRVIFPNEKEAIIRKKARDVFINFAFYLVEFFRSPGMDEVYIKDHFSLIGKENLENALTIGKGAILLTAHIGNFELGGMALSMLGYPIMAIALDHKNSKINDFFKQRRVNKGMEVVSLGASVKHCFRGLRDNKFVAILGDRDFSNSSYPLDLLGRKKNIPRGPAVLALSTGSPIVPVFVIRQGLGHFTIECLPPVGITKETSEIEIMKKCTKIIEEQIYKKPTQWLMFREFWKE